MTTLPRGQVPMWLATINSNRVKDERARQALVLFQTRCAEVLDAYWSGLGVPSIGGMELDPDLACKMLLRVEAGWQRRWLSRSESMRSAREIFKQLGVVKEVESATLIAAERLDRLHERFNAAAAQLTLPAEGIMPDNTDIEGDDEVSDVG